MFEYRNDPSVSKFQNWESLKMTEAIVGILQFLFAELKKHRVYASVDPENTPSSRVLEKSGFRKEAHFRKSLLFKGQWTDDVIFAALNTEWVKNNGLSSQDNL